MKLPQSFHPCHLGCCRVSARPAGPRQANAPRVHRRRGVLLLVVLSLLVLFALIGITFLLMAGQNLRTMKAEMRTEQTGDDPRKLLDEVFAQCIRDTNNPHSVLRTHSLLNDMYGNDGVKLFTVVVPPATSAPTFAVAQSPGTNGQMIDITIDMALTSFRGMLMTLPQQPLPTAPSAMPLNSTRIKAPGFFNGCVLTPLNGVAAHQSTRVVGSGVLNPSGAPNLLTIRFMAFEGIPIAQQIAMGCNGVLINGRPFNGTGFGFRRGAGPTDQTMLSLTEEITLSDGSTKVNLPLAFLPNAVHSTKSFYDTVAGSIKIPVSVPGAAGDFSQAAILGGADEDYDAADGQNLLLAHLDGTLVAGQQGIIPSLHRPEAVEFIRQNNATLAGDAVALQHVGRQAVMRPQTYGYTPATNEFPPLTGTDFMFGPFDVDNDGDGIRESIWVDVGLPVQTAADGRMYKPLAAILCLDMDGRLNVNAHGNSSHVDSFLIKADATTPSTAETQIFGPTPLIPTTAIAGNQLPGLPRGQGYGPPEISLFPLFSATPPNAVLPQYAKLLATRYAEPNSNLANVFAYNSQNPNATSAMPGITNFPDPLAALKFTGIASEIAYTAPPGTLSEFGSPENMQGTGYVALDVRGMPLMPLMGRTRDAIDSAYELNLSRQAARASDSRLNVAAPVGTPANTPRPHDAPFTPAELERVLRLYDIDAQDLPDRLHILLATGGPPIQNLRNIVTTDSFDLPTPSVLPTRDMRRVQQAVLGAGEPVEVALVSKSIADLLKLRMLKAGRLPKDDTSLNIAIQSMLPAEVASGLRFDLNRPFGNGRDDNSNGVVDESGEPETQYWVNLMPVDGRYKVASLAGNLTNGIDMNADNTINGTDYARARQLYARHLYILMMLLKDEDAQIDFDNDGVMTAAETARGLAQWAVNVVDFRDRDSAMTMFEYNINPFKDGWTSDGVYDGDPTRGIVWGCERPELLISETLAFHDVRTEDLDSDNGGAPPMHNTQNAMNKDPNYDQRVLPRGSLFIELYNPWVTQGSVTAQTSLLTDPTPRPDEVSGEFYTNTPSTSTTATGVNLNVSAPGGAPVWRMLIAKPTLADAAGNPLDPYDPNPATRNSRAIQVDRSVYFINTPPTYTDDGLAYCSSLAVPPLLPGRYAVIGPAGINNAGSYVTPLGGKTNTQSLGQPDKSNDGTQALATTRSIALKVGATNVQGQVVISNNGRPLPEPSAANMQPPIAIVMDKSSAGANARFSVSEPIGGYTSVPGAGTYEPEFASPLDTPLDLPTAFAPPNPLPALANTFRFVHLQRLADPKQAFDATTNPYLTVDTAPISLTVFNGIAKTPDPAGPPTSTIGISSVQRGDQQPLTATQSVIWPRVSKPVAIPSTSPTNKTHNFNFVLNHSLGFLNAFGWDATYVPKTTAYGSTDAPSPAYIGAPKNRPLTWLNWNNRPFVGPAELLMVPKSSSFNLMYDYAPPRPALYTSPTLATAPTPFGGHLLEFFISPGTSTTLGAGNLQLHRILEYVQVPSRFVGTDSELDPAAFNLVPFSANEAALKSHFHPPFNRVSNYRNPGRININTIPSDNPGGTASSVWQGIFNQVPGATNISTTWTQITQSRAGGATITAAAVNSPTQIANPFRTAAGASLGFPGTPNLANRDEVDVTLLRPLDRASNTVGDRLLFDYMAAGLADSGTGANTMPTSLPFRLQNLQKYHNLLTTRSNVYAIWVTVGFFEVQPMAVPTPAAGVVAEFPDGYKLKGELGADTGETKRHRAFYLYDRSIPVGFEPGRDHNIENGLLLKRFIE